MHRRACVYFKTRSDLKKYIYEFKNEFLEFTNRYRPCIFIEAEKFVSSEELAKWFDYNSVIEVHEVCSQYLTYESTAENTSEKTTEKANEKHIQEPFVEARAQKFWVHDIDTWVQFPEEFNDSIKSLGAHVFIYPNIVATKAKK